MTKHNGTIVINSTESGDFYFNVVAENGNIISSSKMYPSEKDLLRGIEIVKDIFSAENLGIVGLSSDNE
tara:strand:+ start:6416 stop:6622 length:207 start_codon:yes stop_codon:yes gene_type:complete